MSVARVEPLLRMPWTQRCGVGCEMSCICDQIKVFSGGGGAVLLDFLVPAF